MSQAQDELVARASDPHAELSTLHELAQNYPGLRPYIAANPRTYPELLEWLGSLGESVDQWLRHDPGQSLALVGDWNVAPRDEDVWDMSAFDGATHVSQPEREAFAAFEDAGLSEVTRPRVTNYTYWDYQKLRFPRNEGMRIDFIYGSPTLQERITAAAIDRDERKGKGASDHVPVIVDVN